MRATHLEVKIDKLQATMSALEVKEEKIDKLQASNAELQASLSAIEAKLDRVLGGK